MVTGHSGWSHWLPSLTTWCSHARRGMMDFWTVLWSWYVYTPCACINTYQLVSTIKKKSMLIYSRLDISAFSKKSQVLLTDVERQLSWIFCIITGSKRKGRRGGLSGVEPQELIWKQCFFLHHNPPIYLVPWCTLGTGSTFQGCAQCPAPIHLYSSHNSAIFDNTHLIISKHVWKHECFFEGHLRVLEFKAEHTLVLVQFWLRAKFMTCLYLVSFSVQPTSKWTVIHAMILKDKSSQCREWEPGR